MKKRFALILLVAFLLISSSVFAQESVTIKKLNIQLWPEYDRPEMLVMYTFELADETPLPASVQIRIPTNAELNAVAKIVDQQMLKLDYETSKQNADWVIITILADELSGFRVEYYVPLIREEKERRFTYLWQNDLAVENLFIEFQQPINSKNLKTEPLLLKTTQDGIIYHTLPVGKVAANEPFRLELSYEKDNDFLTASTMPVEVGGESRGGKSSSFRESLPSVLLGLGVLLIIGGMFYFFAANRQPKAPHKKHRPHSRRVSASAAGRGVYCHECGARAHSGDRFCRACGAKLRL